MEASKLTTITQLIEIRKYISGAINNFSLDKKVVAEYNTELMLVDRMIQELLLGQDFKSFIKFEERDKIIREVAAITNIKTGLKK